MNGSIQIIICHRRPISLRHNVTDLPMYVFWFGVCWVFMCCMTFYRNMFALSVIQLVDDEMFWVATEVCSETNIMKRVRIVKQFIKIARKFVLALPVLHFLLLRYHFLVTYCLAQLAELFVYAGQNVVCADACRGGTNHNRCTQRLVIVHAQTN